MSDLSAIDLRFRKDLPILRRISAEPGGAPLPRDQVQFGESSLWQGQDEVGQAISHSQRNVQAPATTAPAPLVMLENSAPSVQDVAQPDHQAGGANGAGLTFAEMAKAATKSLPAPPTGAAATPVAEPEAKRSFGGMLKDIVSSLFGNVTESQLKKELRPINALEAEVQKLKSPQQFQAKTAEFKQRLANGETLESLRIEAYAVARQAAKLALGMRPFDCQVLGGLALDSGRVAEMKTGEGKTLTAILPLYLNALAGKGAHLVTVNDTLAARDSNLVTPAFEMLGMTVGCVLEGMDADAKREGYNCDITYTTDRTLGFDYLRDRTARRPEERVQRKPFFALVDELDEVLLDEARTPLIISGRAERGANHYQTFNTLVQRLKPGDDYQAEEEKKSVWLTELGLEWLQTQYKIELIDGEIAQTTDPGKRRELLSDRQKVEDLARAVRAEQAAEKAVKQAEKLDPVEQTKRREGMEAATAAREAAAKSAPAFELYDEKNMELTYYLEASLRAHVLFHKGTDYIVDENGVQIVDKNKGRTSEGRRYSAGLHQALEVKEGILAQDESRTTASITYPNLFKQYPRLAGMTGTAWTSRGEIQELYGLETVQISPNKPMARVDEPDEIFKTQKEKYAAVARAAARDFFEGRPVLIGTLSVEHNKYVVAQLLAAGVPESALQVLNAESVRGNKEAENEMIENAGRSGVITVATNLAGRGADIKPDMINFKKIGMEVAEALAAERPVIVEVDKAKDAEWLCEWLAAYSPRVVDKDSNLLPEKGQVVVRLGHQNVKPTGGLLIDSGAPAYETEGLTVYGTERAESRRIDDQLIGRSGRQGARGRTKFFLSLEDELFVKHGGSAVGHLKALFQQSGQGQSGKLLDALINAAQANAEALYAQLRKQTTEQDETMNLQREAYFGLRDQVLENKVDLPERVIDMAGSGLAASVLLELPDKKTYTVAQVRAALARASEKLGTPLSVSCLGQSDQGKVTAESLRQELVATGVDWSRQALQNFNGDLRDPLLDAMDLTWSDHLEEMDALKTGSEWQKAAQMDPEVFFKIQSADVFDQTLANLDTAMLRWAMARIGKLPPPSK